MMEEVSDDTNGESTFEFVGGKNDEHKDSTIFLPPTADQGGEASNISFYDPAQYSNIQPVVLPFPQQPPPTPIHTDQQSTFLPPQQSSPPQATIQSPSSLPFSQCSVPLPGGEVPLLLPPQGESGMWGWIKNTQFLNKVAEKAKSSVDSVITTLDPGMKEIINSGGDISIVVATGNETKISAVREAFQLVFGKATVQGIPVKGGSIAPQPVGFSAGLKAAEERITSLRQQGLDTHVLLAIENFIVELTPDNWFDMGCLLLQDLSSGLSFQVYTQAIPVSSHYVQEARDRTPADYPLAWSGHALTIGHVIGGATGVHHSQWQQALTGVSRREMLFLAAKTMAGLYKAHLRR